MQKQKQKHGKSNGNAEAKAKAKEKADSAALLRNDKQKGLRSDKQRVAP